MKHSLTHVGIFVFILPFAVLRMFVPFALAQTPPQPVLQNNEGISQQRDFSPQERESLDFAYRHERFSVEYYSSATNSLGEQEQLLFKKVREEDEMHLSAFQNIYQTHSLQPPTFDVQDPYHQTMSHRTGNLDESLRAGIDLEKRQIEELHGRIESVRDYELKNFLSYLRIESYLHMCEMFVFADLNHISVNVDSQQADACRRVTALQKIPQPESVGPQSFRSTSVVVASSQSLLAQAIYQPGNALDYGSFYQGYGYRYLNPTSYNNNYGGYPNYGGSPNYGGNSNYGGFPRDRYSGDSGDFHFDFNFYFHQGYDRDRCYSCGGNPYGGGGGNPYGGGRGY